jgi:hypothetical protein
MNIEDVWKYVLFQCFLHALNLLDGHLLQKTKSNESNNQKLGFGVRELDEVKEGPWSKQRGATTTVHI